MMHSCSYKFFNVGWALKLDRIRPLHQKLQSACLICPPLLLDETIAAAAELRGLHMNEMGSQRVCMVVLLPSAILVALFLLISRSTPWPSGSRWSPHPGSAWQTKALELLALQEAQLHAALNSSTTNHTSPPSEEFVAKQLAVNGQLQQILRTPINDDRQVTACHRTGAAEYARRGRLGVSWQPRRGRYLVMICTSGQVTNHLVCLRKHMYFAAVLQRTLVLPPGSLDYRYEHLLDLVHLQQCLNSSIGATVMTFQDFEASRRKDLHVGKLICYMPNCYFDQEHQSKWEALGFTFEERQDARTWSSNSTTAKRQRREDIAAIFEAGEEQVIAVGDLFYAEVVDENFAVAPSQIGCGSLIRPHPSIVVAAHRFVQTYLGGSFVAVHFRRHGFLVFCNKQAPGPSCFYPIPQAARCIESKVREAAADVVFLSTDAPESEAVGLVTALAQRGVAVVRRSAEHEVLAKWDSVLWRQAGREAEGGVMAMVDKAICALAVAFVGTRSSSFSADIQSMRRDLLTASSCDAPLCHGHGPPSFQAPSAV